MQFKKAIHHFTRKLGFDFYALKDRVEKENQKLIWLKNKNIKSIIDVGANVGQFTSKIREINATAKIYSFEPIASCHAILANNFKNDKNFMAYNYACGDTTETLQINVNNYSPSSSILDIQQLHIDNFKHTASSTKENIKIDLLDNLIDVGELEAPILIKIDTQGFEKKVIAGAQKVLSKTDIILIELSYQKLYKDQSLFHEIYTILYDFGFQYIGNMEELLSPIDGVPLQSDGIFIKR
jgi:FkbM family methyltransferase